MYYFPSIFIVGLFSLLVSLISFYFKRIGFLYSFLHVFVFVAIYLLYGYFLDDFIATRRVVEIVYLSLIRDIGLTEEISGTMAILFTILISFITNALILNHREKAFSFLTLVVLVSFSTFSRVKSENTILLIIFSLVYLFVVRHYEMITKKETIDPVKYLNVFSRVLLPSMVFIGFMSHNFGLDLTFIDEWLEKESSEASFERTTYDSTPVDSIDTEVLLNTELLFTVETTKDMYFRYQVFDSFINGHWQTYERDKQIEIPFNEDTYVSYVNYLADVQDLMQYGNEIGTKYYELIDAVDVTVRLKNITTDYIYLPLYTTQLMAGNQRIFKTEDDIVYAENLNTIGFEYDFRAYVYDYKSDILNERLKETNTHVELTAEDFDKFTQIDRNYRNTLKPLVDEITKGYESDYEKLLAIEAFLRSNFTYNIEVNYENDDFLETFLFDVQSGYCVHYATTFTLMARTLGIPTRYVEGYVVDVEPNNVYSKIVDGRFVIDVTGESAHSFPEVYFDDIGWVRFEPTPNNSIERTVEVIETSFDDVKTVIVKESRFKKVFDFIRHYLMLGILITSIVSFIVFYALKRLKVHRDIRLHFIYEMTILLFNLKDLGFELLDYETLKEFYDHYRIDLDRFIRMDDFKDTIEVYYSILYDNQLPTPDEMKELVETKKALNRRIYKVKNIYTRFIYDVEKIRLHFKFFLKA
jgi:transglutaminase-like putative cysteine protease